MNNIFVYYDETNTHLVSSNGIVQNTFGDTIEPYKSSSNILYSPYTFDGGITRLKRLDIIVALTFNPIPDELIGLFRRPINIFLILKSLILSLFMI